MSFLAFFDVSLRHGQSFDAESELQCPSLPSFDGIVRETRHQIMYRNECVATRVSESDATHYFGS